MITFNLKAHVDVIADASQVVAYFIEEKVETVPGKICIVKFKILYLFQIPRQILWLQMPIKVSGSSKFKPWWGHETHGQWSSL